MERPDNPRYPHTCVIWRQVAPSPLIDEDVDYDPLADEVPLSDEGTAEAGSSSSSSSSSSDEETEKVIVYKGKCRAYDKHTTSDRGEVITSFRGLALPLTRTDWERLGVIPMEGDEIEVDRGGYKEYGRVVDKSPANFGGTHLVWRYGRN